jgi:hypothetical protein
MVLKPVQIDQNWEEMWIVCTIWNPVEAHSSFFGIVLGKKNSIIGVMIIFWKSIS